MSIVTAVSGALWRAYQLKESLRAVFADDLDPTDTSVIPDRWCPKAQRVQSELVSRPPGAVSVEQMLAQARSRLQRLTPAQAFAALAAGALLADIRPKPAVSAARSIHGATPRIGI